MLIGRYVSPIAYREIKYFNITLSYKPLTLNPITTIYIEDL